ncbi:MAG: S-methyl-5-thioribose-1-phosphate isomerase [Candidatus Aenigmarchaeota archaeon]|nr:S-methyl-5-thioribose-1-phosphate isomerase [Candidatus Aenigmarchaeota archaeon]
MEAAAIVKKIKTLEIQGAKNVALAGLKAINLYASGIKSNNRKGFMRELKSKSLLVAAARPTEPALRNAISFVLLRLSECKSAADAKKTLASEVRSFSKNIENMIKKIGEIGARRIPDNAVVFTHCHSNTVMEILRRAKYDGKKFEVVCTETRPLNQGLTTAKQLAKMRIPVTLIVDSAARAFIKKCDMVLIGADAITSTGDVVNKIGSSTIALIAEEQRKPLYVAAATHKIDPQTAKGFLEPIEERPGKEIVKTMKGVKVRNPAFDVVHARRISGIITELGIVPAQQVYRLVEKLI